VAVREALKHRDTRRDPHVENVPGFTAGTRPTGARFGKGPKLLGRDPVDAIPDCMAHAGPYRPMIVQMKKTAVQAEDTLRGNGCDLQATASRAPP
jgi:hypothetical protein